MHPVLYIQTLSRNEKLVMGQLLRAKEPATQAALMKDMATDLSQSTVSRAMKSLMKNGVVLKTGHTKGSRFVLSEEARRFAIPPHLRTPVPFDRARISAYVPNRTRWLHPAAHSRMEMAAGAHRSVLDASSYSQMIAERFMIDLSWASSNLEGNTYDHLSAEVLLKYGQAAEGKSAFETRMLLNHKAAIEMMIRRVGQGLPDASDAHRLHSVMMDGLIEPVHLGRIRKEWVGVTSTSYWPSSDRNELARAQDEMLEKAGRIEDPFEASFFLLVGSAYIQPYIDGNKRMGRILANAALLERGMPPLSFVELDRRAYILGLLAFYEIGDSEILSDAIAHSYECTAPHFARMVSGQRLPSQVELGFSREIKSAIARIVRDGEEMEAALDALPVDKKGSVRDEIESFVMERLEAMSPFHAPIYGIEEDEVTAWLAGSAKPPRKDDLLRIDDGPTLTEDGDIGGGPS